MPHQAQPQPPMTFFLPFMHPPAQRELKGQGSDGVSDNLAHTSGHASKQPHTGDDEDLIGAHNVTVSHGALLQRGCEEVCVSVRVCEYECEYECEGVRVSVCVCVAITQLGRHKQRRRTQRDRESER